MIKKNKLAQEEMIGFALIIIVVAVILIIFLGFSLRSGQKEIVESYEVNSFIQAFLQYTTNCEDNKEYLTVQKLISSCHSNEMCLDGRSACKVLDSTLTEITKESWKVTENTAVKGYELKIVSDGSEILLLKKGDSTNNYKSSMQDFSKRGGLTEVSFTAYY